MNEPATLTANETPITNDAPGTASPAVQAGLQTLFQQAAGESNAEQPTPKRKPGQRGPDKSKRKRPGEVPVGTVGEGTPETFFVETPPSAPAPFVAPAQATLDRESQRRGIEAILSGAEGLVKWGLRSHAAKRKVDPITAKAIAERGDFPSELRAEYINCLLELWEKYFPNVPIGPESRAVVYTVIWAQSIKDLCGAIDNAAPAQAA